ncbi:MAG TPA: hypothetical protein VME18_00710 [Acidobacteriaceae bacterium]|nr:hypothetical protein [Acidobacteriaceae bacterium]
MNVSTGGCRRLTVRLIACSLAFLVAVPFSMAETNPLPSAPQPAATSPQAAGQNQTNTAPPSRTPVRQSSGSSSSSQPVGTAAAPLMKPVGVAASRPAGAAIAPAKQRRIRVLAIRWGLILGAAIALGTVAAATMGSPRRPN